MRVRIPSYVLKKEEKGKSMYISMFFCLGNQGGRRCRITLECKEKVHFFRLGPCAMLFCKLIFKLIEMFMEYNDIANQ